MAPNIAVLGLMIYKITIPNSVKIEAMIKAVFTDILPAGIGLFFVRSIKASRSLSMIWLKALEAPTIKYPPNASNIKVETLTASVPNRYPARDENTTLSDNLIFVIQNLIRETLGLGKVR